jgi:hypothetical protein
MRHRCQPWGNAASLCCCIARPGWDRGCRSGPPRHENVADDAMLVDFEPSVVESAQRLLILFVSAAASESTILRTRLRRRATRSGLGGNIVNPMPTRASTGVLCRVSITNHTSCGTQLQSRDSRRHHSRRRPPTMSNTPRPYGSARPRERFRHGRCLIPGTAETSSHLSPRGTLDRTVPGGGRS